MESCAGSVYYYCCFNAQLEWFEYEKENLAAIRSKVLKDIEYAEERNEAVDEAVQHWLDKTEVIIEEDTKARKKWFHSWCPDCIWQYRQRKKLAKKMQDIEDLIRRSYNFHRVSYQVEIPRMDQYLRASDFTLSQSMKSRFEELVEALESGNYNMIGLQGLGGVGKTTLAKQVCVHVEQSKAFQKVIFITVSHAPDIRKIQGSIARLLDLYLEEGDESEHSKILWSRIANDTGRLLIILDDLWSKLNLKDIGIPYGNDHENCCVLVTTRHVKVCRAMRCQLTIHLHTLTDEESFNLFMRHANHDDLTSNDFREIAQEIVKACGGLPIAIETIARALRNSPVDEWKYALRTLRRNSQQSTDFDDLTNVFKCLRLSYDNLSNEKAKNLFLLCSLFPKDYQIPISLLISLGIGAGIFGEVDKYSEARNQALGVKNELITSSLLLEDEKKYVKMHDLVHEMAQAIAEEDTQVIMNSMVTPKSNLRFLFWSGDDLPNQFHGTKLEVLLLQIKGYTKLEDANAIFEGMGSLRVLVLRCDVVNRLRMPLQSFLLLKNIRTLILNGWKLDDISNLKSMRSLETLELNDCSITELPKEIEELKRLKLLGLRGCSIERNNPFEVIERCSGLEELYFVGNHNVEDWKPESNKENIDRVNQDTSPLALQMYHIACSGLEYFDDDEKEVLKCFNTKHVKCLISSGLFQYLLERAEVLEFSGKQETRYRSLVPDFIPIEDRAMKDLIKLCLYEWDGIEYLIDASRGLPHSEVTFFSKLEELHLREVEVEILCRGPIPPGFLEQLQVLRLSSCTKLQNIFPGGSLKLPNLKVLQLEHCPMVRPFIFKRSVAASLVRLEELVIEDCNELRSLMEYESLKQELVDADHRSSCNGLFPMLQTLKINGCEKLEVVLPLLLEGDLPLLRDLSIRYCEKLGYIFDEYQHESQFLHQLTMLPSLTIVDLYWVPSLINILREFKKLPPLAVADDSKKKHAKMQHNTISLESLASRKGIEIVSAAECLFRPPMGFQNIRHMKLWEFPNLRSLFSLRIAATITLEKLEISYCKELEHIVTNEWEDYEHISHRSIFPKLQVVDIYSCNKLEYIFPSTFAGSLTKLNHLVVAEAPGLKYIFGKSYDKDYNLTNEEESGEVQVDLSALETLSLTRVPNMINICAEKHDTLSFPSLRNIALDECQELSLHTGPLENLTLFWKPAAAKEIMRVIVRHQKLTRLEVEKSSTEEVFNCEEYVEVEGPVIALNLELMRLKYLRELRYLCRGPKYILSLQNLRELEIKSCPKLSVVFDFSMSKNLRQLSELRVNDCPELVELIEEDYEEHLHACCFPSLEYINIGHCGRLRFLFSISTFGTLPMLRRLEITDAPILKHVFTFKQDDDTTKKMTMENVFPKLTPSNLLLKGLPRLTTFCEGIDFQTVPYVEEVVDSPRYQAPTAETAPQLSEIEEVKEKLPSAHVIETHEMPPSSSMIFEESTMEAMMPSISEISPINRGETSTESEAERTITESEEEQSIESSPVASQPGIFTPFARESEDEQRMSEPNVQPQHHQDRRNEMTLELTASPKDAIMEEKPMQVFQEHLNQSSDGTVAIQSTNLESRKQSSLSSDRAEIAQTIKEATASPYLTTKKSTETFLKLLKKDFAKSTKELSKKTVEVLAATETPPMSTAFELESKRPISVEAARLNFHVHDTAFSPPHRPLTESQIGSASTSSSTLEIAEILALVKSKDDERALLVEALDQHPKLRLPRHSLPIISFAYRVLIDILTMVSTKTHYTMTEADKTILEANLGAATYFGFDKDWVESVRTKVSDVDMLDILETKERFLMMEAKLEEHDSALENMKKEKEEAKERLAMARRQLEMAQSEFETIDSQLLNLMVDCQKLITNMAGPREISAKDESFGI